MKPRKARGAPPDGTHVVLGLPERTHGSMALAVRGRPKVPDSFHALREPPDLPEGDVVFVDQPWGITSLVKAKKRPAVLPLGGYLRRLVVDAPLVEALGALDGVVARPTELRDDKGRAVGGYTLLDVAVCIPLDRSASKATWVHGWLDALERPSWRPGAVLPPMFRLLDRPAELLVRRDLAEILVAAEPRIVLGRSKESADLFPPGWSLDSLAPVGEDREAEDAFWALLGGDRGARARAVRDPWWAYAVGAAVDRAPAEDTREGACGSPVTAVLYAANVERAAHDRTRAAANASGLTALRYATHLDHRLDPKLRPLVLRESGHDEETLAEAEQGIEELRLWLRGEAPPEKPLALRREWPVHGSPRYAGPPERDGESHAVVDAAVQSDIDAFVPRGYRRLGLEGEPRPEEVVDRVHRAVDAIQSGATKLKKNERTAAQMELGCAWGEQLHRALGWQWASVAGGLALVSRDRAVAHHPFAFVGRLIAPRARGNTVALLFNMLAAGQLPPSKPGSYTPVQ